MTPRRLLLAFGGATLLALPLAAQQQPIYGCRHAINCRPRPTSANALNDGGTSGLLVSGSIRWGPGFHFGLSMPILNLPAAEPPAEINVDVFHLYNVTLLPTPLPSPIETPRAAPAVTPTPATKPGDPRGRP